MKHLLCLLLAMLLLIGMAMAEPVEYDDPKQMPLPDASGFLPEGSEPAYYMNHHAGYWVYLSSTERIEINRYRTDRPLMTYYVADIRCKPGSGSSLMLMSANPQKPTIDVPPQAMSRDHNLVYVQNGDFFSYRVKNKHTPGHIVRAGKILYDKSFTKMVYRLPNLATMGLYPDGHVEVNEAWEKTGEEYVAEGATDVIAFGPILVRDGVVQDVAHDMYTYREPRSCIGMVKPGHYIGLLVEGRKNHSKGADMLFCAEKMAELGCTQAINLDGGGTSCMLFMGQPVQMNNKGGFDNPQRYLPDVFCAGVY